MSLLREHDENVALVAAGAWTWRQRRRRPWRRLAIRALPDRQREALVLRYYLDMSEEEIARTMNISRGTGCLPWQASMSPSPSAKPEGSA